METDIRIMEMNISFSDESFRVPLRLSTGDIRKLTYAKVAITVENRRKQMAVGQGSILLSDLWAFQGTSLSHREKDHLMRDIVMRIGNSMKDLGEFLDPFQVAHHMEQRLTALTNEAAETYALFNQVPSLVPLVCWSSFDAAIHDAWSRATGMSAYAMYNEQYLNHDLGHYLGEDWRNSYPEDFLAAPQGKLWVQHVIGASDPLTSVDQENATNVTDDFPITLEQWIVQDGLGYLKIKAKGIDVAWDVQRMIDVYQTAKRTLKNKGYKHEVKIAIDPNEACPSPEPVIETLRKVREKSPEAYAALQYIEQPTSRDLHSYPFTLHELVKLKPVIIDESLDSLDSLYYIDLQGWSGVALKSCKGHSHVLLTYCWARRRNLYITMQDLTNPGLSLVHSANMCSHLAVSNGAFEYNSRQYIPNSALDEVVEYTGLLRVHDGQIDLATIKHQGLY